MNNTATTTRISRFDVIRALHNHIEDDVTPDRRFIAVAVERQLYAFGNANDEIMRTLANLRTTIERTTAAMANGQNVNSLGVVQSAGTDLDRACALRDVAAQTLRMSVALLADSMPAVAADIVHYLDQGVTA